MTALEAAQAALKKYPKARKIAVENFVFSASADYDTNRLNLEMDRGLYKWNMPTVHAILHGLKLIGK